MDKIIFHHAPMSRSNIALITGITGQDGSYLTELLLGKGAAVGFGLLIDSRIHGLERLGQRSTDRGCWLAGRLRARSRLLADRGWQPGVLCEQ